MLKKMPIIPPRFVDGVEKLHAQLHDAYSKAQKLFGSVLGTSSVPKGGSLHSKSIRILVDFNETQPEDKLTGYFVFGWTIARFLPITFDMALLFPVHNHGGGDIPTRSGITYDKILKSKRNRDVVLFNFMRIEYEDSPLYSTSMMADFLSRYADKIDDVGQLYFPTDLTDLSVIDIPKAYTERSYTLVGERYYSPYVTKGEAYCVLFAQFDNEYDSNAIKVLRWFPVQKGIEAAQMMGLEPDGGDVFFELGYISRQENSELHSFMVENHSQLLFGKKEGNSITLLGGVKMFKSNDLKYTRCLYKIALK